jgi:hypothetical protein
MKLIRLLATAMAAATALVLLCHRPGGRGVTAPNYPAVGTAPAGHSASRGAAVRYIGRGTPRSDERIYYPI